MKDRENGSAKASEASVRTGVRRDELIDVSARIFAAKGYGNTSIQDIADELGLLKGSLYYYIDTKEDLLFEVIRSTMVIWKDLVDTVRASKSGTLDRLRTYLQANIEGSLKERDRTAVFVNDFRILSKERQQVILEMRSEHDELLRDLLGQAKAEKIIAPDVDEKVLSLAILTMNGSLYRWYDPSGKMQPSALSEKITQFALRGLGADV